MDSFLGFLRAHIFNSFFLLLVGNIFKYHWFAKLCFLCLDSRKVNCIYEFCSFWMIFCHSPSHIILCSPFLSSFSLLLSLSLNSKLVIFVSSTFSILKLLAAKGLETLVWFICGFSTIKTVLFWSIFSRIRFCFFVRSFCWIGEYN